MTAPTPQLHNPDLPRGAACPPTALGTKRAQRLFTAVPRGADPVEIKGCPPRSDPAKDTRVFAARTGSGASGTAGPRPHPPPFLPHSPPGSPSSSPVGLRAATAVPSPRGGSAPAPPRGGSAPGGGSASLRRCGRSRRRCPRLCYLIFSFFSVSEKEKDEGKVAVP